MKPEELKKIVADEFSSENAQEMYVKKAEEGLWESERYFVDKYFKKKGRVLDIGCGTGRTTIPLFREGYDTIGIDISNGMIDNAKKIARKKGLKIDYRMGDATDLEFKAGSFDYALFSNQGWTQIPDSRERLKSLKEVYRILKPEGVLFFTSHERRLASKYFFFWLKQAFRFYVLKNLGFEIDEMDFGDRFFDRENSGTVFKTRQYIHISSINEVKNQIEEAGFELVEYKRRGEVDSRVETNPVFFVCKKIK